MGPLTASGPTTQKDEYGDLTVAQEEELSEIQYHSRITRGAFLLIPVAKKAIIAELTPRPSKTRMGCRISPRWNYLVNHTCEVLVFSRMLLWKNNAVQL